MNSKRKKAFDGDVEVTRGSTDFNGNRVQSSWDDCSHVGLTDYLCHICTHARWRAAWMEGRRVAATSGVDQATDQGNNGKQETKGTAAIEVVEVEDGEDVKVEVKVKGKVEVEEEVKVEVREEVHVEDIEKVMVEDNKKVKVGEAGVGRGMGEEELRARLPPGILLSRLPQGTSVARVAPSSWPCPTCTFINPGMATTCNMCSWAVAEGPGAGVVGCPACTFYNAREAAACSMCDAAL